jgi:hypothetical protein
MAIFGMNSKFYIKYTILLSSYLEYIESIGFTPKILNFFRLSRAVAAAAVDRNLCHAHSLDHKT